MKTLLAALLAASALAAAVPAVATEPALALRGSDRTASAPTEAKDHGAAPSAETASTRKVRVVLASPYGN